MYRMHTRRQFMWKGLGALALAAAGVRRAGAAAVKRPLDGLDLGALAGCVDLVRRSAWDGPPPKTWLLREAGQYDRLTVHHQGEWSNGATDRNAVEGVIRNVCAGHQARGYGDVGYHFVVDTAGRVWEGRSLAYEGAHVSGENERNLGIMLLGNFEEQRPAAAQVQALDLVTDCLREIFMIKRHRVYGHRDLNPSACPGRNLYGHVVDLRT
ncbi:MAG: N-acetylmuramoyl-L-alanine amidase [Lentisphaerae bacterium]|nr:N-acetylmuramoyl-L-alanine amidase [Lentisphaerota bacterium]